MPLHLAHVWRWFVELDSGRQSGFSVNPLSHVEIYSYCMLNNIKMSAMEVRAIKRLDRLKIEAMQ